MVSIQNTLTNEKLKAINYSNWRFKIEMLFIRKDFIEVITDEDPTSIATEWTKNTETQGLSTVS